MTDAAGWGDVYAPAEDSYLLAGASVDHIDATDRVLDVGTGSGVVADRIRSDCGASVVGVDLNPHACREARERGIPVVRGHLVTAFRSDTFDVVVCNPPYLPTDPEDHPDDWLGVAVSGGETGRAVVDALFQDVGRILRPHGRLVLLTSSLMDVTEVHAVAADAGFSSEELARDEGFPFEVLAVLAFER